MFFSLLGFDNFRKHYHVREFEDSCSKYFGSQYTNTLSSGTASIKCALKALGVQPGDEVITQSFNFIATIEAILDCGATPVICSIDSNLHLDVDDCLSRITSRTKCVIIVHMLGMAGPVHQLKNALDLRSPPLPLVEDACESVGAMIGTSHSGTVGDIGVFGLIMEKISLAVRWFNSY